MDAINKAEGKLMSTGSETTLNQEPVQESEKTLKKKPSVWKKFKTFFSKKTVA
jgi:hypothetical protein